MSRVIHFEIQAQDPDRAAKFYGDVFAWGFTKWDGVEEYWMIDTGSNDMDGINGGLLRRMGSVPAGDAPVNGYVCIIGVNNIDTTLSDITSHGGVITQPKKLFPGIGYTAYAKDTEGNSFGVIQAE